MQLQPSNYIDHNGLIAIMVGVMYSAVARRCRVAALDGSGQRGVWRPKLWRTMLPFLDTACSNRVVGVGVSTRYLTYYDIPYMGKVWLIVEPASA